LEEVLANTSSAKKRIRQNEKRSMRNQDVVTRSRTYVKRARMAMDEGDFDAARESVEKAVSEIDRAVSKGVIHANNGARRKSRLMIRLNSLKAVSKKSE
jgi:small subunit ribosomal protein S20